MTLPDEKEQDYDKYIAARAPKPLRPNQLSYWQNYGKFFVSLMKSWWGDAATAENHWGYDYLPKLDKVYDMLQTFELMDQGKMNGYICQGFNPLASAPNKAKMDACLAKLKFLVDHGSARDRDVASSGATSASTTTSTRRRSRPKCSACRRPASPRRTARSSNSGRWLQWHWKGANPPGEAHHRSGDHGRPVPAHARDVSEGRRRVSRSDRQADLAVRASRQVRRPRNSRRNTTARRSTDLVDPKDATKVTRKAGEQLAGFAELRDDGSDRERLLDLLRRVGADRQPDGAARQLRSDRHRPDAQLGLGLAGEPAHSLQPRVLRRRTASRSTRRAS